MMELKEKSIIKGDFFPEPVEVIKKKCVS